MSRSPSCPNCQSTNITARNYARKVAGVIGATGSAAALLGSAILPGGSSVAFLGRSAKVLLGILAGCATGVAVGKVIDDNMLANLKCRACGHTFSRIR
ncbi:MAG: hypothetical protein LBF16_00975 [Pseudomonadales bacterium]|jgi:hypothetical protein|nr:hypothetical protein [Pseudomonadales bacterium]